MDYARSKLQWNCHTWKTGIFSYEKKFNLDGPDGLKYYWNDIRDDNEIFSKNIAEGGSVMVWGAIYFQQRLCLIVMDGRNNYTKYCNVLQQYLIPVAEEVYG